MQHLCDLIQYFFENILFAPLDYLRTIQQSNWWAANALNWIYIVVAFVFFVYWIIQLKHYSDKKDERTDIISHSFFK